MHVILIPIGSSGDVHPQLALGSALLRRGHRVTIVTSDYFKPLADHLGLEFVTLSTKEEYEELMMLPDLWHPRKGFELLLKVGMLGLLERLYETLAPLYRPGETVFAASSMALSARLVQEKLGAPLATVHLQPAVLRSMHEHLVLPGMPNIPRGAPHWFKRLLFYLIDLNADWLMAKELNRYRAKLDLPPVRRALNGWWNSPQLILAMFPKWFAPPPPDWPKQLLMTGFPLFDAGEAQPVSPEAAEFFAEGEPPIVFTAGTAMRQGADFFHAAAEACRLLGRRGALLTPGREQLPQELPPGVRHFDYAPFGQILPQAAAFVNHGGIGTLSQGLAAGVPQLIMPVSFDQPDNAYRLQNLGAGLSIKRSHFRPERVAQRLEQLLQSEKIAATCRAFAEKLKGADPFTPACEALERLV